MKLQLEKWNLAAFGTAPCFMLIFFVWSNYQIKWENRSIFTESREMSFARVQFRTFEPNQRKKLSAKSDGENRTKNAQKVSWNSWNDLEEVVPLHATSRPHLTFVPGATGPLSFIDSGVFYWPFLNVRTSSHCNKVVADRTPPYIASFRCSSFKFTRPSKHRVFVNVKLSIV